jgi:hypothetical protein
MGRLQASYFLSRGRLESSRRMFSADGAMKERERERDNTKGKKGQRMSIRTTHQ